MNSWDNLFHVTVEIWCFRLEGDLAFRLSTDGTAPFKSKTQAFTFCPQALSACLPTWFLCLWVLVSMATARVAHLGRRAPLLVNGDFNRNCSEAVAGKACFLARAGSQAHCFVASSRCRRDLTRCAHFFAADGGLLVQCVFVLTPGFFEWASGIYCLYSCRGHAIVHQSIGRRTAQPSSKGRLPCK